MSDFLSSNYYQYSRKFRVDLTGVGDFVSIKEACDTAALLPRDFFNYVLIEVNAGVFLEEPFTVPSFVIIKSEGHTGEIQFPCTLIAPATLADTDTEFIRMEENSVIINTAMAITVALPADFLADYSFIVGEGNIKLDRCSIQLGPSYSGANTFYLIDDVGPSATLRINRCSVSMGGDSVVLVRSSVPANIPFTNFGGTQLKKLELNHVVGTTEVVYSNLYNNTPGVVAGGFVVDLAAGGTIELNNTRLRRSDFTGGGTIVEVHPTPAQLLTALKAAVRLVAFADPAADKILNAQADGTLWADTTAGVITVTMPPISGAVLPAVNTVEGETFVVGNTGTGGNDLTVTGDGGDNIEGVGSITLSDGETAVIQRSDSADAIDWHVISTNGGGLAGGINIKTIVATPYTILNSDDTILVDTTISDITVNAILLASTQKGRMFTIKKITADANKVIVNGNGVNIDNAATFNIVSFNESIVIQNDQVQWWII